MIRLKCEQYAVGEVEHSCGVSATVGIFYAVPITEDVEELTYTAQAFARVALDRHRGNHTAVVETIQLAMKLKYPDRPYYVETSESGRGVQVYQPYGMPQESWTCEHDG